MSEHEIYLSEQHKAIDSLRELLASREAQLREERSDVAAHNQLVKQVVARRGADVAPEDALDTIMRLEALGKLEARRNELLARENIAVRQSLVARRDQLKKLQDQMHELVQATGWKPGSGNFRRERADAQQDIEQMKELEQKLTRNLKAADLIINKKQHTIQLLQEELKKKKVTQDALHEVYNHIRVKDRDCQEVQVTLKELAQEEAKRDKALDIVANSKDLSAFASIEADNKFLKEALGGVRVSKGRMDDVCKMQLERLAMLKSRMAALVAAMHDLRVDARYAAHAQQGGGAVIVATPIATDEDLELAVQHANPPAEVIAPECFDLLSRDYEQMNAMLSRKEIILLEKQLTHEALCVKLHQLTEELDQADADRASITRQTASDIQMLRGELQGKHESCRFEIDQMLTQNRRLRQAIDAQERSRRETVAEASPQNKPRWTVK